MLSLEFTQLNRLDVLIDHLAQLAKDNDVDDSVGALCIEKVLVEREISFEALPNLNVLRMVDTGIERLDNLHYLNKLVKLVVMNTRIRSPVSISNLERLRVLNLKNCNLTEFPPAIAGYSSLEILNLSYNPITHVCEDFLKNLFEVRMVNLSNCLIEHVPKCAFETTFSIRHLDLSCNPLKFLNPDVFQNLVSLRNLDIHDCKLMNIPHIPLRDICSVKLYGNKIRDLRGDIYNFPEADSNLHHYKGFLEHQEKTKIF